MSSAFQFAKRMENKEFLGNLCPTCNSFMFKLSWWRWRIGRVPFKAYLNYFWTGFSLYFRLVCSCSDQLQLIPKRSQKWSMEFWKCSVFSACLGKLELGKSASGLNQMQGNSVRETDNVPETLLFCIRTCINVHLWKWSVSGDANGQEEVHRRTSPLL